MMFEIGLLVGLLAYLAYLAPKCAFRVGEGHAGVVTTFGRAARRPDGALIAYGPGLHVKWPWQKARNVSLMEEIIDLSGTEGARTAMAADGTVLRLDSVLRFLPLPAELYNYVFDLRAPREHITSLFTCLLRNEIANFAEEPAAPGRERDAAGPGGSYALLRQRRSSLNEEIMAYCHEEIGSQYGVRFRAVDLVDIRPPEELDEALNAALQARVEADMDYAHAEAIAQRRVIAAHHGVEVAKKKANAVEQEILTLARHLAELDRSGTLELYVARRTAEVLSQSKHHYVRRTT